MKTLSAKVPALTNHVYFEKNFNEAGYQVANASFLEDDESIMHENFVNNGNFNYQGICYRKITI